MGSVTLGGCAGDHSRDGKGPKVLELVSWGQGEGAVTLSLPGFQVPLTQPRTKLAPAKSPAQDSGVGSILWPSLSPDSLPTWPHVLWSPSSDTGGPGAQWTWVGVTAVDENGKQGGLALREPLVLRMRVMRWSHVSRSGHEAGLRCGREAGAPPTARPATPTAGQDGGHGRSELR